MCICSTILYVYFFLMYLFTLTQPYISENNRHGNRRCECQISWLPSLQSFRIISLCSGRILMCCNTQLMFKHGIKSIDIKFNGPYKVLFTIVHNPALYQTALGGQNRNGYFSLIIARFATRLQYLDCLRL